MITDLRAADWSTPAVVLKFDQNVLHHGSLGVIRSLGRLGVPVYGVHEGPWAPAASSRYLAGRFFWQPRPDDPQRTLSGLFDLASQIGRRAVLYATDDAGAIFLAEHGDVLREAFAFPRPAADLPRRLAGKYSMFQLCRDLGVPTPQAMLAWSPGEAAAFAGQAGFPLIAKLTTPWRGTAGPRLRSTTIVRTPSELQEICACAHETSTGLMLQEYIPPAPGQDWFFHGYFDTAGRCQTAFTGVKDRSYPAYAGLTSLGRAVPNSRAAGAGHRDGGRASASAGSSTSTCASTRGTPSTSCWTSTRASGPSSGCSPPAPASTSSGPRTSTSPGSRWRPGEMTRDRRFLVENYDPLGAVGYWRRGELGLRSWAASLRRVDEVAWLARDDLRPFGLMCARMAWRARSARRLRASRPCPGSVRAAARRGRAPLPSRAPGRPAGPARARHVVAQHRVQQRGGKSMNGTTDVAIVGAGPYGLSVAAHLRRSGRSVRQFGLPMRLWRDEHAPGHVPEVPGLRLQPVRPGGQADPGRVLPGDRASLRGLRPARAAGHVRRLRPVVPVGRRPGRRGSAGDRGVAGRGRLRAHPGGRGDAAGPPGGRGGRESSTSRTCPSSWPGCPPVPARTARRTPTWPRSPASGSPWSGPASPPSSRRPCCTSTEPRSRS